MRRVLAAVALAALFGCSDGNAPPAIDMAMSLAPDFAGVATCSVDGVRQSCGSPACAACLYVSLPGICVIPCKTSMGPTGGCPLDFVCHLARIGDGGATAGSLQFDGDCAAYDGYCG
jgi:hypothetical protein